MMPNCNSFMYFPYSADIYYATVTQDAWGAMQPSWTFGKTIRCQVVNVYEDSSNDRPMLLENQNRFMMWDESYVLRTQDNILEHNDVWYTPETIMVKNVRTSTGMAKYWADFAESDGSPKKFEVRGVMPILDAWEGLHHYKITISVSNNREGP